MVEQHAKALVPEIRFAGFTDPWEQRKLGELCSFSKGYGYSKNNLRDQGTPIILYGRLYTNYETQIHSVDTFVDPLENSVYTEGGEVIVPASGETAEDISIASVVEKPGIILGGDLNIITPSAVVNPVFLALELSYGKPHFDLAKRAQGKSVVHIHNEDIANVFFDRPCIAEQRRIGAFFDRLDSLITLHQRKYDKLCVLKKSMLDKMFPKGGSVYPEIRFAGFTDPWEQRKLENYVVVSTTKNVDGKFGKEDVLSVSGEYGVVNQITFQGRSFAGASVSNYGVVNTGDVVYTKSPLNSNPYGIIKVNKGIPGIVSTLYAIYHPRDNVYANFIQVYFEQHERMNNYMHPLVNKGAKNDMKVTAENALKGMVTFPSREEQYVISAFFSRLDSLITLHQRKLELLRNIKKSMLDKMFV